MKKLLLLSSGLCSFFVFSQTITYANHNPNAGDVVNNVNITGTVDNSPMGSGVTFNNATVTMGAASATTFSTPTATEITTYPGTNLKATDASGTTTYYQSATGKLEISAIVNPTATLNFTTDKATALVFPFAFGNTNSDTASGTFLYSTYAGTFSGTVNSIADASGTLIIGPNTYTNVLRVKSIQDFDLFYTIVPGFPPSNVGTATSTTYQYFQNSRYPLLISGTSNISVPALNINQTTDTNVAQQFTFLGVNELDAKKMLYVFPNPVEDLIQISGNLSDFYGAELFSMEGRLVRTFDRNLEQLNVSDLESGNYHLVLKSKTRDQVSLKIAKK